MIFLLETFHPAGIWEVGPIKKNQAVVGNGLQAGMTFLQVTGLQVGMIFLLETFHLAGIWEVGLIMKNQAVVGNGLQAGMTFLQVTGLPAGIWEVGNLDHQLADKMENDFFWNLDLRQW